jgi:hypothetical protein
VHANDTHIKIPKTPYNTNPTIPVISSILNISATSPGMFIVRPPTNKKKEKKRKEIEEKYREGGKKI